MENLEKIINDAWENKEQISQNSDESIINYVYSELMILHLILLINSDNNFYYNVVVIQMVDKFLQKMILI